MHGVIEYTPSDELAEDDDTWWTKKTLENFKKASRCIIHDYDRFTKNDSIKVKQMLKLCLNASEYSVFKNNSLIVNHNVFLRVKISIILNNDQFIKDDS